MFDFLHRYGLSLGLCVVALSQTLNAAEWTECLEASFNNVAKIKTFDLVFTGPFDDGQSRVAFDGDKWLIESPNEIRKTVLSAKAQEELRIGNNHTSVSGDFSKANGKYFYPINDVYFWLGLKQQGPFTFAELQDKAFWNKTIEAMQSKGTETIDGKECETYSIGTEILDVTVWFSKQDHGLPIQFQVENKKLKRPIKTTVSKVATFDETISVPQSTLISNAQGEKHCELDVEKSSVNAKIDASVFNIVQPSKATKTP